MLKRYEEEQKIYEKNQKYQEKVKNSLAELQEQQEELVLQWISFHLRRLVSRDRERSLSGVWRLSRNSVHRLIETCDTIASKSISTTTFPSSFPSASTKLLRPFPVHSPGGSNWY